MKKIFFSVLVLFIVATSCKNMAVEDELQRIWDNCPEKFSLAESQKKIVGEWKHIAVGGLWLTAGQSIMPANQNVKLVFSESMLEVFIDDKRKLSTKYRLENAYNPDYYSVKVDTISEYNFTYGVMEFCTNKVAFRSSYVDGTDNYFQRVK